ncbi:MAG: 4-hydroxythreonine-4-phosphate dehydrogenase PdxA [Brevundimonas sp.]|uniref:4-hydroxythreonine-4-phosphate dehydrogenase PdxA n=1 Tax=Brevundimonas sp. TaxID=1871086 RepID=UPI00391B35F9
MSASSPAPLVVSMGEPAGIGPEIIAAAWRAAPALSRPWIVIGDAATLEAAGAEVERVTSLDGGGGGHLRVLDRPLPSPATPGRPDPAHGARIMAWVEEGVRLCLEGSASALVTAPIGKASLYASGFRFPGHTEFIADICSDAPHHGPRGPVMMLSTHGLRAVLVTIHEPLARVPGLITGERVAHTARVAHASLKRDFGMEAPRLVLAGLNPHAGEAGTIGTEERDILEPAVASLRAEGIDIRGPLPADTLFHDDARAGYDAAVCLYHDQALIPVKTLDFWAGVNTTLGLPVVRTSPDHGTGLDIAGQGRARPDSLIAALVQADSMAAMRALAGAA